MESESTSGRKPTGISWERWIERQITEAEVRSLVEHLNDRIRTVNRTTVTGPPTTLGPMPVEEVLERWHRIRAAHAAGDSASGAG